jgi:hypothetical protein
LDTESRKRKRSEPTLPRIQLQEQEELKGISVKGETEEYKQRSKVYFYVFKKIRIRKG